MRSKYILLALSILVSLSCHKDPVPQPAPPDTPADIVSVRLKDVNGSHLPSPFYHFEYNDSGYITHTSFSSGLATYDVIYANKRILRMENKTMANKDILKYQYSGGDVTAINIIDKNGNNYRRAFLGYTSSHQLQTIDWEVKVENVGFAQEQTLQFSYYPDGNLKELVTHNYAVGSQTAATYTDRFENYDNKVNVDAFSLLQRDQNHHLYLLPSVRLQLNNPSRNVHTGDGVNYDADYNYTYDAAGRPSVRAGDVFWRSGADSGKHFQVQTTYSYYN